MCFGRVNLPTFAAPPAGQEITPTCIEGRQISRQLDFDEKETFEFIGGLVNRWIRLS